ncbi:hypothetical protein BX600DRAFT_252595 [Xylariales sp. PMI_506]|nr:hypothetical protein BX600DRAFT_252595 [Xylariales sp. PMI_506]
MIHRNICIVQQINVSHMGSFDTCEPRDTRGYFSTPTHSVCDSPHFKHIPTYLIFNYLLTPSQICCGYNECQSCCTFGLGVSMIQHLETEATTAFCATNLSIMQSRRPIIGTTRCGVVSAVRSHFASHVTLKDSGAVRLRKHGPHRTVCGAQQSSKARSAIPAFSKGRLGGSRTTPVRRQNRFTDEQPLPG